MQETSYLAPAVAPTVAVVRALPADRLDAPTPCADWTVRQLVAHMLEWGPVLEAAARKEPAVPVAVDADLDQLDTRLARLATAWREPAAWEGVTRVGGPTELPASMIGAMVLGEIVVHGWDLARATGQPVEWPADLLEFILAEVEKTAETGRGMGVYGDPVPVPDTAPVLDRLLGLTGRDPGWRA